MDRRAIIEQWADSQPWPRVGITVAIGWLPEVAEIVKARRPICDVVIFDHESEGEDGDSYQRVTSLDAVRVAMGDRKWPHLESTLICSPEDKARWAQPVYDAMVEGEVLGRVRHMTLLRNTPQWVEAALEVLPAMAGRTPVQAMADQAEGLPGLIVGAGPSLDKAMPWLVKLQDKLIIVAVETALPALDAAGVRPDIVAAVETSVRAYDGLEGLGVWADTLLVLGSHVHPMAWQLPAQTICPALQAIGPIGTWLADHEGCHSVQSGGSVGTFAHGLLDMLGCSSISGVGIDSAYTSGRGYATGVVRYRDGKRLDLGKPIQAPTEQLEAWGGVGTVGSNPRLRIYRDWFGTRARVRSHIRHMNMSEGGARIPGWDELTLRQWAKLVEAGEDVPRLVVPDEPLDLSWCAESLREQLRGTAMAKDKAQDAIRAFNGVVGAIDNIAGSQRDPDCKLIAQTQFSPLEDIAMLPTFDNFAAAQRINETTCATADHLLPLLRRAIERLEKQYARAA
ncbi:MAG: DUF115 domain-containing protein [bacterium]|nr:DUF115 domain-containing protein [bacterium]